MRTRCRASPPSYVRDGLERNRASASAQFQFLTVCLWPPDAELIRPSNCYFLPLKNVVLFPLFLFSCRASFLLFLHCLLCSMSCNLRASRVVCGRHIFNDGETDLYKRMLKLTLKLLIIPFGTRRMLQPYQLATQKRKRIVICNRHWFLNNGGHQY